MLVAVSVGVSVWVGVSVTVGVSVEVGVSVGVSVWVGVFVGPVTTFADRQFENSEVLPLGSVAMAVTDWPDERPASPIAVKLTLPEPSVLTGHCPRYVCPSPCVEASHTSLPKKRRVKAVLGVLLRVPLMVVLPPMEPAVVSTG